MELRGKRVVLTGGAGFIGSHVADRLVAIGAETVVIDDLSVGRRENLSAATAGGAHLTVGDIGDKELMERELEGANVVLHMACDNLRASLSDPRHTHEVNATGTLNVALAAVGAGVERFVYVSSSEAYGSAVSQPMGEDHPLLPMTVYGASKAAGELIAQACMRTYGLPVCVVRPFNSYGPREHAAGNSAEVIPKFVSRIQAGLAPVIFGDGSQTRDFTWVEETAVGIVAATECDALVGEAVNIAFGTPVSIRDIADSLIEIMAAPELKPEIGEPRPGDVDHHWADISKATTVIGFRAEVPIADGLARYVKWVLAGGDQHEAAEPDVVRNW